MVLNTKIYYRYKESKLMEENYYKELTKAIQDFFLKYQINCVEFNCSLNKLSVYISQNIDMDILISYAIDFSEEFDMTLKRIVKKTNIDFENNKRTGMSVEGYRLIFEKKYIIA